MKKKLWTGCLFMILLLLLTGCKAENQTTLSTAYTPVQEGRSMTYDEATDRTTLVNGEISLQLTGQWEEKDGCYINATYGFVNLIRYKGLVTVYDYTNSYSSSASWSIADQDSQLTITPDDDKTIYGFHLNSEISTYQFIYASDPGTTSTDSASLIATVLSSVKLQADSSDANQ